MSNQLVKSSQNREINFFDPQQFETMQRISTMFSNSELVPERYRVSDKNPKEKAIANCMIAISTAQRIGADPLLVMQNLNIIQGTPSWSAKFLTATVNACGQYNKMKYKHTSLGMIENVEYTEHVWDPGLRKKIAKKSVFKGPIENFECIAYTSERGSDEVMESVAVTIKMAIEEGWMTKDGSKWKTMSPLMLQYRAVTFWTNSYAPELSMGIKTTEEIQDMSDTIDVDHIDVTAEKVKNEIKEKANAEELKFSEQPDKDNPKPTAMEEARTENFDTSSPNEGNPVGERKRGF
ncbi:hypothetical protein [Sphingobacterium sp. ML3W]|uniref:hypothetical protein n=1 Tax=Sphingobacterium sp. ML3W TaxID=1538644 RepID=UPI00068C2600|nr:hypothetical protein [Sphingobacterium sp. ML3W]